MELLVINFEQLPGAALALRILFIIINNKLDLLIIYIFILNTILIEKYLF